MEHRKSQIIPPEIRWIFGIEWPIVALITDVLPNLISPVQLSNLPVRKVATSDAWDSFVELFRGGKQPLPRGWGDLFGALRNGTVDDLVIVGQLGQSLDGRIATVTGHSKYINCPAGIEHLHRLRSLVDIVVVGVGTAIADNPQLTVRQVPGPQPARAVIDPRGRLGANARLFAEDGVRRILITAEGSNATVAPGVEIISLPAHDGDIAPSDLLSKLGHALRQRGPLSSPQAARRIARRRRVCTKESKWPLSLLPQLSA